MIFSRITKCSRFILRVVGFVGFAKVVDGFASAAERAEKYISPVAASVLTFLAGIG
ncbi:MAG: hypothetical protein ACI8WB_000688 [Phenylobacterium sp.]